MLIYWILFIVALCFSIKYLDKKNNNYNIFANICFVYIFLYYSLRSYCVGTDTIGYLRRFYMLDDMSFNQIFHLRDPLFYTTIKILRGISRYNILVFTFIGLTFVYCVGKTLKKQSDNIFLSLLILIVFRYTDFTLNAMRNGLAVSLAFYSLNFLISRKIKKFIFCVLIASLLHKSLLIFIVLLPLSYINLQKRNKIFLFLMLLLFALFTGYLYDIFFVHLFVDQYELYKTPSGTTSKILTLLIVLFFYIITFFGISFKEDMNRKNNILFISCSLSFVFALLATVNPILDRLSLMFGFSFALIIPYIISKYRHKYTYSFRSTIIVLFFTSIYILGGPAPGVLPYSFFWNPKMNLTHKVPNSGITEAQELPILP